MAVTSGFFDSVNSDRLYNSAQLSTYFEGLISDGIYESIGNKFIVKAATGMNITVGSGRALIKSRWIRSDSDVTITLDAANVQLSRIDAIVLRLDLTEEGRQITIEVKKGVASNNPVKPTITRTASVYELCLAYITVNKGTMNITQSAISDQRSSSLCGWVTGLVTQVDTSELFLQYQMAYEEQFANFDAYMEAKKVEFNTWFESLTATLQVNTTLSKLQRHMTTSTTVTSLPIGIDNYNQNTDVLMVYVNGILLIEDVDYTISGQNIVLTAEIYPNNDMTFIVLRNVIGGEVLTAGDMISTSEGTSDAVSGVATFDQAALAMMRMALENETEEKKEEK